MKKKFLNNLNTWKKKYSFFDLGYNTCRVMIHASAKYDRLDLGIYLLRKIIDHGILPKQRHVSSLYLKCQHSENPEHQEVSKKILLELFNFGTDKKIPHKDYFTKKQMGAFRLSKNQTYFGKPFTNLANTQIIK